MGYIIEFAWKVGMCGSKFPEEKFLLVLREALYCWIEDHNERSVLVIGLMIHKSAFEIHLRKHETKAFAQNSTGNRPSR